MQRKYFDDEAENMGKHNHLSHNKNIDLWQIGYAAIFHNPEDFRSKAALDFGCGGGRNIQNIASFDLFSRIDGCDISSFNLVEARKNVLREYPLLRSEFFQNSGVDCKIESAIKYHFIFSTIVLQHIPVWAIRNEIISNLLEMLDDDGILSFQMGFSGKKVKKAWGLPLRGAAVGYFEEKTNAGGTNGRCDVAIDNPFDLIADLEKLGATDINWRITPSFEDLHPLWIWVQCKRSSD
jgi:2-polyprenyl-3-methyl-5-hydroxy-6-metoxy-1,4-benzoquinol methylase